MILYNILAVGRVAGEKKREIHKFKVCFRFSRFLLLKKFATCKEKIFSMDKNNCDDWSVKFKWSTIVGGKIFSVWKCLQICIGQTKIEIFNKQL